jgi:N-acetylmuramoyl-L-alanine amidase
MRFLIVAGHWEKDVGAVGYSNGKRIVEARGNLNVALELEKSLIADGHEVIMYRRTHEDAGHKSGNAIIADVQRITKLVKADYAIHIHHNAGGGKGYEVCVQVRKNVSKQSEQLANCVLTEFAKINPNTHGNGIIKRYNSSRSASYFGVLRTAEEVGTIAIITEFAFLDTTDVAKVDTLIEQQAEAKAIYNGILNHIGRV